MKFQIEDVTVYFPYDNIYPEQYSYMVELKRALDAKGHALLEMPTGTGKTIALLSLITSYALSKPSNPIKLLYCTRTVHEMEKTLAELRLLHQYQLRHLGPAARILALGLSSRKNLCINPAVNPNIPTCQFFENYEKAASEAVLPPGVYTLQDLRAFGRDKGWCPYFLARHMVQFANVVVYSYQYLLDPKVAGIISKEMQRESVVVFDEAHNIDNVCIEALSVSVRRQTLEGATRNLSKMAQEINSGAHVSPSTTEPSLAFHAGCLFLVEVIGSLVVRLWKRIKNGWADWTLDWHRMHKNAGEPLLSESITFELVISFGGGWECLDVSTESKKVSSNFSAGAGMVCAGEQGSYLEGFSHLLGMDCLKRNEQIGLKEDSFFREKAKVELEIEKTIDLFCTFLLTMYLGCSSFFRLFICSTYTQICPSTKIEKYLYYTLFKATDAGRLRAEYNRLVEGLAQRGNLPISDTWLANPALPDDILKEAVPGNIRRAEHFLSVLRRLVQYLHGRLETENVEKEGPVAFVASINSQAGIDQKMLKFCYDRLHSLMLTLEITDTDEFLHIQTICDFATLVGTYTRGFSIIIEPFDERMPHIPDPVLQLSCHDASLAIKPVFERFQSVVITSGTLSPIDLYPRLLNFNPVVSRSFTMSLTRNCICPMVLTRGSDQLPVSTKFDMRSDPGVVRNYGRLLLEMVSVVPDGIVCFFVSYSYMDGIVNTWNESGILKEIMQHKLVFIETQDVVETTLALDNYRRACDCGRGAVFFSVARGKVAEGIDFDRHYGRLVIMFGVPFQYTLSRILLARLEYLRETFQIKEGDFLTFDALRQAAQCVGRVIRSKADYGMMIFADKRYSRHDKRSKLPGWILSHLRDAHLNLSTDMALHIAREFLRKMAQPYDKAGVSGRKTLLSEEDLEKMGDGTTNEMLF
ncbi:unnamed protein product, partial [Vitis vinifera]